MRLDATTLPQLQPGSSFIVSGWARRLFAVIIIVVLLGCCTLLTYVMGGTATVYPYFILIPVLLSASVFGLKGGLLGGLAAGLLLGPLMPLDVAAGEAQTPLNWFTRVGVYMFLGGFTGWLFTRLNEHSRQRLAHAYTDAVSGLPNRQSLQQHVAEILAVETGGADQPSRVFVISIQLQNYQSTVSALGFSAERPLLREMGKRLVQITEPLGGRVYHVNDDHFAILLVNCSRRNCLKATQSAVTSLQQPFNVQGIPVHLGAYAGVSSFPFHEREEPGRLITKAWMAMYEASEIGRTYCSYKRQTDDATLRTVQLLGELQTAIDEDQLMLYYQPQVDLRTGQLVGVEALVRWQHPERGLVSPGEFIPAAEGTGLIHPLTRWVLHTAMREMETLRRQKVVVMLSVNVSARNFLDSGFVDDLLDIAAKAGLKAGELELEFTETAMMTEPEVIINQLHRLVRAGISLAIDDFGTGHSSLAYLKRLPVSVLKLDQTFIRNMAHSPADAQIVGASNGLAQNLGMKTVAEGVEDTETLNLLASMGCDAAQGYGIARPMPAAAMLHWASQRYARPPAA